MRPEPADRADPRSLHGGGLHVRIPAVRPGRASPPLRIGFAEIVLALLLGLALGAIFVHRAHELGWF